MTQFWVVYQHKNKRLVDSIWSNRLNAEEEAKKLCQKFGVSHLLKQERVYKKETL